MAREAKKVSPAPHISKTFVSLAEYFLSVFSHSAPSFPSVTIICEDLGNFSALECSNSLIFKKQFSKIDKSFFLESTKTGYDGSCEKVFSSKILILIFNQNKSELATNLTVIAALALGAQKILPLVKKNESLKTFAKLENDQEPKSSVPTTPEIKAPYGYVVQVGSFRDEGRAGALRRLLKNNGFDAFLTPTELTNNGGTWHRVFLGRYIDEENAQEAARLARSQYKLNAVVARNTG